jgi:hypothetical protein
VAEQLMENLSNEEHEQLLLMSEHAVGPPLSATAQAVLTAFSTYPLHGDHIANTLMYGALPAALRAAADHIDHDWSAFNCIDALCEVAAELEAVANV